MITTSSFTRALSINHQVPGLPNHASRLHPHTWTVRAEFGGDPIAAEGMAVVTLTDLEKFRAIFKEYQGGNLNELMAAGLPTMEGFGLHLMERCSGALPTLRRIILFDAYTYDGEQHSFTVER